MTIDQQPRTFADHVLDYAQAGWPCILPVPARDKTPPPVGFTGAEGRDTDPLTLVTWTGTHPHHSIALRMPDGVIGIDVDQYLKGGTQKRGAETLAACLERWGPLPATWTSTARDPGGPSRIYFFRVPAQRYDTKLTGPESGDVEIIQRHHRYAVVWPSVHHTANDGAGSLYRWYDPAGHLSETVPKPDEFPLLPDTWVAGLAEGATDQGPAAADRGSGEQLLGQLLDDWRPECAEITNARLIAADELARADAGSRHDTMTARTHHLVQLAASGHTGVAHAVLALRETWDHLVAGENREGEYDRMLLTSARKAVTVVGVRQVPFDPCAMIGGFATPAPAPDNALDADGAPLPPVGQARWFFPLEVIGTHAFDPIAQLDQPLAQAVLERTYPLARYAYDAKVWLMRGPERWEIRDKDLTSMQVAQVAWLMPRGNPEAEKGSIELARHQRHGRFHSAGPSKAIASKMQALVAAGTHPSTLKISDLDAEQEVLWAGGQPWSLRSTARDVLALAAVDPAAPHLHAAAVAPQIVPTPLWDAFLTAVWPDPTVRAWALRVLSISLTGYSDKALPMLQGERDHGKTQVVTLLMSVLGSYAYSADARLLSNRSEALATGSIVHDLKGRRLAFIDEGPRDSREGQEKLKWLTGGGDMSADAKFQNAVTWRPTHTLVLTMNDPPVLTDPAVRSRTRLIPCDGDPEQVIAARAAIGSISSAAWRAEAPGVLAQMMAEAGAWLADPASASQARAPEGIRYSAEIIAAEQDPITRWLEDETEPYGPGTPARELYSAFVSSCLHANIRRDLIPSETRWGLELTRRGYPSVRTEAARVRQLRIRYSGGFLPTGPNSADGLQQNPDGLPDGFNPNPSGSFSQVNPSASVFTDGSDGLNTDYARDHAHAGARTQGDQPGKGLNPSDPSGPVSETRPKPKREQTEAARLKRAAATEARRTAAVAEAAGYRVQLPAVVTRDQVITPCTAAQADDLLATITAGDGALTVDVEHTGYPIGHADYALRTVQLGNDQFAIDLDPADPDQADVVRRHLAAARMLHAHSATADLIPLAVAGLGDEDALWAKMVDTAILAKLSDPSSTDNSSDLKNLSKAVLGAAALSPTADDGRKALFKAGKWLTDTEVTTPVARSGWAEVDPSCSTMVLYATSDVLDDAALARRLPMPPPQVLDRERTVQRMTARMASTGFRFNADQIERLVDEHTQARAALSAQVSAFAVENPGSNQQVGEAFGRIGVALPRTGTGKPSVAAAVLEPIRNAEGLPGDLARAVLGYRHHDTALKLLLEPWREMVHRGDGRARSTIYTLGADTGRMSSVRFNFQQVSREGGMRACITADPGYALASADFAGVELRTAGALSRDEQLIAIMNDPSRDLHWEVARLAFGPQATKAQRYAIKRGVFGRIYGGGVKAVADGVGVSIPVAQQVIDAMDALTPQLAEWSRMVRNGIEAGRTQFPTAAGRVIHLPKLAPHAGPNYCIQGTARELLVDALLRWRQTRWGEAVLLPVHDEIVVMVPEDEAQEATAALVECMTADLAGVPIVAEASEPSFEWKDSA